MLGSLVFPAQQSVTAEIQFGMMTMGLLGGLALFLYGMGQMTEGMKAVAGDGMRKLLSGLTRNRFLAVFTGAFVTAVVQSSSVTTVLVVGFISAGLMSLAQSVGIIMGANVGTTVTAQIVAFKVTKYAMAMIALGFFMSFMGRRDTFRESGKMVMGLGLIFFGMNLMSDATQPLRSYEPFIEIMRTMDNPFLGMLVGAAFTALVQSSSATTGIVIVLASGGFITLEAGIALALGANLGTCVTAMLAGLGKPPAARQAAGVHVLFNLLGALVWLAFIPQLAECVRAISPEDATLTGTEKLAAESPRQIANAHTVFNLANTVLFVWFTGTFAWIVQKLMPERPEPVPKAAQPLYLDEEFLQTPALAVDRVALEVGHLGDLVVDIMVALRADDTNRPAMDLRRVDERSRDVEILMGAILDYSRRLSVGPLTSADCERLDQHLECANQLNNITDTVATNLGAWVREWQARQIQASEETRQRFRQVLDLVIAAVREAVAAGKEMSRDRARKVIERKTEIHGQLDALSRHLSARLLTGESKRVELYRLESRVLEILRRLYYFAKRIAKVVAADIAEHKDPDEVLDPQDVEAMSGVHTLD